MALAILEPLGFENGRVHLRADTGTNEYFQLKVGRSVRRRQGIDWIDDVLYTSPLKRNVAAGDMFNSATDVSVPAPPAQEGDAYVQLFSFKTAAGKSPAFSRAVRIHGRLSEVAPAFSKSLSVRESGPDPGLLMSFRGARRIPLASAQSVPSLDDLLAAVVKVAGPLVLDALKPKTPADGAQGSAAQPNSPQHGLGGLLLNLLLSAVGAGSGIPGVSTQQSIRSVPAKGNRFAPRTRAQLSRPFIAGIDDALLATLLPDLVKAAPGIIKEAGQALPLLINAVNAANHRRLEIKQANNKLMTDLLAETNRRMLLEKLIEAQKQPAPAGGDNSTAPPLDLAAVIQLLAQAAPASENGTAAATNPTPSPASPASPPSAPTETAKPKSLAQTLSTDAAVSSRAILAFAEGPKVQWQGSPKPVFTRSGPVDLRFRLQVANPVPAKPLPKAIVKIGFRRYGQQATLAEKVFKRKDVAAGSEMAFSFSPEELAQVPPNECVDVIAELRWLTGSGTERRACGSAEIVFVDKYLFVSQGKEIGPDRELTDMQQYRSFWNKVWASPSLSTSGQNDKKKYNWEIDADLRYTVLLTGAHDSNGVMDTKAMRAPADPESLTDRMDGRMKSGIELSVAELNKLLPLWDERPPVDAEKLNVLKTGAFTAANGCEFIRHIKMKGRGSERGVVWVVPVFKLFDITLSTVTEADASGRVTQTAEEKIAFPLPASARIIGVKSQG